MTPLLTACVPTIPGRESVLSRLLFTLTRQPMLEVIVAGGVGPMGDKVNAMFAAARGDFVVVIDDDDTVAEAYMAHLASSLKEELTDFVGHDILWLESGKFAGIVKHSLKGDAWWGSLDRGVTPKCPTRTAIARAVPFGNGYTADRSWSTAVHPTCRAGAYVPAPLYIYDHWNAHMVGTSPDDPRRGNPQRDVGSWPFDREAVRWLA